MPLLKKVSVRTSEGNLQLGLYWVKAGENGEEYRLVFGEVATKGSAERFKGNYLTDGLEQPQLFAVPDLHTHELNDLKIIKTAFEIGQK